MGPLASPGICPRNPLGVAALASYPTTRHFNVDADASGARGQRSSVAGVISNGTSSSSGSRNDPVSDGTISSANASMAWRS